MKELQSVGKYAQSNSEINFSNSASEISKIPER